MKRVSRIARPLCCSCLFFAVACATPGAVLKPDMAGIEAFNRALTDVTTRMDNAGLAALWEEDGISLLPATGPLVGRKAILAMVEGITTKYPGAHMLHFEMDCSGIEVAGVASTAVARTLAEPAFAGLAALAGICKSQSVGIGRLVCVSAVSFHHRGRPARW